jgi:acetoacetyl-CoA synthetase
MPFLSKTDAIEDPGSVKELWRPSHPERTKLHHFKTLIAQKYKIPLRTYHDLWQWSVTQPANFWEEVWHYTSIKSHQPYSQVIPADSMSEHGTIVATC